MNQSSNLLSRFGAEFIAQIIVALTGAALIVALTQLLTADDYGLLFLAISVLGVIELVAKLGIGKSAARYVSEYKERDPSQLYHILRGSILLNLATITIVIAGLALTHKQIAILIGESNLAPLLLLGTVYVLFSVLFKYSRYILQGFESIKYSAAVQATDRVTRLLFAIGFVILGYGVLGALAGYVIGYALAAGIGFILIYIHYFRDLEQEPIETGLQRRIAEYAVPLTTTSTANVLDKRVDTILVGFFLTPLHVSYYVLGKQIVDFVEKPVQALGFTLSPTYSAEKASGNIDRAARLYETALVYSLVLYVPAAVGLVLVAQPFIELIFGQEYSGAVVVLQILCVYIVLQAITQVTTNGLDFLGRARERAIIKIITSVANVGFNVLLIPRIGVVGAAIATAITYSVYTFANIYIAHTEFNLRIRFLLKRVGKVIVVTGVMAVVVSIIQLYVTGWLALILPIGTGVIVWTVLSYLLGLIETSHIKSMFV